MSGKKLSTLPNRHAKRRAQEGRLKKARDHGKIGPSEPKGENQRKIQSLPGGQKGRVAAEQHQQELLGKKKKEKKI